MNHLDLDTIHLDAGGHELRENGVCLLEAVAWWAGEPHDDSPACVSPVLGTFGRAWNDALDDTTRQRLRPYIPRMVGTVDDDADELRAWMVTDWLARVCAPAFLRTAGLVAEAERLEQGTPITDGESAEALMDALRTAKRASAAAGDAAWDAAGDAAWAAAGDAAWAAARAAAWAAAGDAAWAAARAAARAAAWNAARAAAGDAAWNAAWAAARAAAWNAAWNAAGDAAWAAARAAAWNAAGAAARDAAGAAAGAAARAAAWAALKPTVEQLQESAFELLGRLCDAGRLQAVI